MPSVTKKRFLQAIDECDGDVSALAELFGKTEATIYNYLKKHDPDKERLTAARRNALEQLIRKHGGVVSSIMREMGVKRDTVLSRIRAYGLTGVLDESRQNLRDVAFDNIAAAVYKGELGLSQFVLTHMPGGTRWSSKQEVAVGSIQLDDATMKILEQLGVPVADASAMFNEIIKQEALKVMAEVNDD
ncbi:MAG: hypothetical protein AAF787_00155 [Chloroflexota bacterium]